MPLADFFFKSLFSAASHTPPHCLLAPSRHAARSRHPQRRGGAGACPVGARSPHAPEPPVTPPGLGHLWQAAIEHARAQAGAQDDGDEEAVLRQGPGHRDRRERRLGGQRLGDDRAQQDVAGRGQRRRRRAREGEVFVGGRDTTGGSRGRGRQFLVQFRDCLVCVCVCVCVCV